MHFYSQWSEGITFKNSCHVAENKNSQSETGIYPTAAPLFVLKQNKQTQKKIFLNL